MSFLQRLFGNRGPDPKEKLRPLYLKVITKAREVHWYEEGGVPDTLDGRFDMVSSVLALVLLRMEQIPDAAQDSVYLTELFVSDMDAQMREAGIGDVVVAKDMGKVMSALGGRLGAFRGALGDQAKLAQAIDRNIYEGRPSDSAAHAHVTAQISAFMQVLTALDQTAIIRADFV